jgi:hypothetical protein
MIAIVLLGIVSTALYKVMLNNQRSFAAQTQRIELQQNIRAAATILPAEFRELDAADGDIIGPLSATSITIRAMRQLAISCTAPVLPAGATMTFTVRQQPFFGNRQFFAQNDSILLYYEGNPGTRGDDQWIRGKVTINPTALDCPAVPPTAALPGYLLTVQPTWPAPVLNAANAITAGAPVRGYSTVTYSLWQSPTDNQYYLAQTTGGTTQPLVGPLTGAAGLSFFYYDSLGVLAPTGATPWLFVRMIEIRVRGRTTQVIRQANDAALAYKTDSVIARVALRNNPRCGGIALPPCL